MWGGVTVNSSKVNDSFNGVTGGFETVVPENTATDSYFPALQNSSKKPVFNNSLYLSINESKLPGNSQTGDYSFTQSESLVKTTNVASERNATLISITNTTNTVTNQGGGDWGNVDFNSYLMICSSGDFADDSHILRSSANTQILRSLIRSTTTAQTYPTDVEFKVFNNYDLNITSTEKVVAFAICIAVLPVLALVTGAVIIIRRRHR